MTSEELAKLYAEVVAVRPEAIVISADGRVLKYEPIDEDGGLWRWELFGKIPYGADPATATGCILWHWLNLLPPRFQLHRGQDFWQVEECLDDRLFNFSEAGPTPLEALAEFLKS